MSDPGYTKRWSTDEDGNKYRCTCGWYNDCTCITKYPNKTCSISYCGMKCDCCSLGDDGEVDMIVELLAATLNLGRNGERAIQRQHRCKPQLWHLQRRQKIPSKLSMDCYMVEGWETISSVMPRHPPYMPDVAAAMERLTSPH
mmetsp:Transcript_18877/g.35109  ORF Transcript_18877/g.35109 Transcript_18877/m.35109 type:complete len:143 (+) Transcript_18877:315-743(+)